MWQHGHVWLNRCDSMGMFDLIDVTDGHVWLNRCDSMGMSDLIDVTAWACLT
jgi:hypothetical protein